MMLIYNTTSRNYHFIVHANESELRWSLFHASRQKLNVCTGKICLPS